MRWALHSLFVVAAFSLLTMSPNLASAEDWPQFRGVNGSGVSSGSKPLPTEFSHTEKVAWSLKLGDGIASPIIVNGRTFVTGMTGDEQFTVVALDAATGKQLWRRDFATGKLPRITPPNSHASSTPAGDEKRVYVYFSTLGLLGLDAADGHTVWEQKLPKPAYLMDWGAAASPIVYRDTVFYCQDDDLNPTLFAFDSATGKIRWQKPRPEMLAGYAVPVICDIAGRADVVIAGSGKLKGYDPATGDERWTCNTMPRTVMTSPTVRDGLIYVSVQSYGDETRTLKFALLEWLDTNQNGELAKGEVPVEFLPRFQTSDKNGDGVLSGAELDTAFQSPQNLVGGGTTIQAVRGGGEGDVTATHVVWNIKNRAPSNLTSPLVVADQVFVVKKGGLSSSFDASTGKTHWELSRIRNVGDYYASPIAGDGKIYVVGENGFVVVMQPGPTPNILARNDMGESAIATPSIADGRLYIRTRNHVYCVSEP